MYKIGKTDLGKDKYTACFPSSRIYDTPDVLVPCGKCLACYHNRRMEWQRRLVIESWLHKFSTFVTLTWNDESLIANLGDDLGKSCVQRFLKRFRHSSRDFGVPPLQNFKYFICVELGKKFKRPHYHCIFFGVDCLASSWRPSIATYKDGYPIFTSAVLSSIWRNGFVSVDVATPRSIMYTTKYVLKSCVDREGWYIFSQGLARDYFVRDNHLTDVCRNALVNGFLVYDKYKAPIPRFLDRYLEKYDPDLLASLKAIRKNYILSKPPDLRYASERELAIKCRLQNEQSRRKLDNES